MFAIQYPIRLRVTIAITVSILLTLSGCLPGDSSVGSKNACRSNDLFLDELSKFNSGKSTIVGTLKYDKNVVTWYGQSRLRIFIRTQGVEPINEDVVDRREFWDGEYLYGPFQDETKNLTLVSDEPILPIWEYLATTLDKCTVISESPSMEFKSERMSVGGVKSVFEIRLISLQPNSEDPWVRDDSARECQIAGLPLSGGKKNIAVCPSEIVFK